MPNWCINNLTVKGNKEVLLRFKAFAQPKKESKGISVASNEGDLSLNNFVPYPQEFRALDNRAAEINGKIQKGELPVSEHIKDGYNQGGYEWCLKNWGVKWDVDAQLVTDTGEELIYDFDSAWSPPCPAVAAMGRMFPELAFKLTYEEPGMCFRGVYEVGRGVETLNECSEYIPDIEQI